MGEVVTPSRGCRTDHATNHGELVEIENIACGGLLQNPHQCPADFVCHLPISNPDRPGTCVAQP